MTVYHKAQLVPTRPDGREPVDPDFARLAEQRPQIMAGFLRGLQQNPDAAVHQMHVNLPRLGRVLIQARIVEHTAALYALAVIRPEPRPPQLLISVVLLGGFADADAAALEACKTTPGFNNVPGLDADAFADTANGEPGRRPLMVEAYAHADCFEDPLLRTVCYAFADAFFEQFGGDPTGGTDADGDGGDDGGGGGGASRDG
jgi:hypothetical protein